MAVHEGVCLGQVFRSEAEPRQPWMIAPPHLGHHAQADGMRSSVASRVPAGTLGYTAARTNAA